MTMQNPQNCGMCGHVTFSVTNRWYQYDNGEQFLAAVCPVCAGTHQQLLEAK
jgi:transcription elongation factor Elf1